MASAYAKKTGRLGVCMGTAGPGAIHLLNGLYDAKMDHAPVLALTGQVGLPFIGSDYFQEVDSLHLFEDVAVDDYQVADASQVAIMAGQACCTALSKRGVAHLGFPFEVPMQKVHGSVVAYPVVRRAMASVLTDERLAEAVLALAEKASIPVVNTLPGKGVIPDEHPLALGGLGLLGAKPAHTAMEHADLCIMMGTSYPYMEFLPKNVQMVQIDGEASQIGKRYRVDVGLVGSAEPTLRLLAQAIHPKSQDAWADKLHADRLHWFHAIEEQAQRRVHVGQGVHPQWVADRLSRVVDANANIAIDVGNSLVWMARNFRIRDHGWYPRGWGRCGLACPRPLPPSWPSRIANRLRPWGMVGLRC